MVVRVEGRRPSLAHQEERIPVSVECLRRGCLQSFLRLDLHHQQQQQPIEATGLAVDIFARACVVMSSLFLGPALLELASDAAMEQSANNRDDDPRIYGFRPSSLLSNIAIVSGLLSSVLLPLFGAIVDHTPHRQLVGGWTAAAIAIVKGIEVVVGPSTWFMVALLQILSGVLVAFHTTATYAYTSELADDATTQAAYNTSFYIVLFVGSIGFLLVVLFVAHVGNLDDVGTARASQIVTFVVSGVLFAVAWQYLFRPRPALSHIPERSTLLRTGFRKNLTTLQRLRTRFPSLMWFLCAVGLAEAATSALVTISTTYLKDALEMEADEIGLAFLTVLVAGIPGSKIAHYLAERLHWNPLHNIMLCYGVFTATTTAAVIFMTTPEEKHLAFIFCVFWGIGLGWLHPIHTSAYVALTERGQEAELMGLFLFQCSALTWLPPLTFTIINESGYAMNYGMASLNVYFLLAFLALVRMGKYEDALDAVQWSSGEHVELKENEVC